MRILFTRFFVMTLLSLISVCSFGQQGNIWYFGIDAGLDFNSGSPVTLTNGVMSTDEGCATICDASGNLLFYTDGSDVWDQSHSLAFGGLLGNSTSTQSSIIVPKPGSATNYYIFTIQQGGSNGMNYQEVKVTGGTVITVGSNTNLQSSSESTEKIVACCHSNGTDYWVVTQQRDGEIVSWPVSSTGVGSMVVSGVISIATYNWDDRVGEMKISSQGNRLVLARRDNSSQSELFDFDNSSGKATANLGVYQTGTVYGVEFSANGDYLYASRGFNRVWMYDVSTLIGTEIHLMSGSSYSQRVGSLQMGPDGNIYVANGYEGSNSSNIDVISNVENGSPTYTDNAITLPSGRYSRLGLPNIVSCFTPVIGVEPCLIDAGFSFDQEGCAFTFYDGSSIYIGADPVSMQWTFGDGYSSTETSPTHYYSAPGTYQVCLTVTAFNGEECCVSVYCEEVEVHEACDEPCEVDHSFAYAIASDGCTIEFAGIVNSSNRPIVAWIYDFGDGNTGSGQSPSHTYTTSGTYEVCVTVIANSAPNPETGEGECCVFKFCEEVTVECRSGDEPGLKNGEVGNGPTGSGNSDIGSDEDFNIYPNPSEGKINMDISIASDQLLQLRIIDQTGKLHWSAKDVQANQGNWKHSIEPGLSDGMYMLLIEGETFTKTQNISFMK